MKKYLLALLFALTASAQPPMPTLPVDYLGVPRVGPVIPDANWKTTTGGSYTAAESYWAQSTNRLKTEHVQLRAFGRYGKSDVWLARTNSRIAGQFPAYQLNWWAWGDWNTANGELLVIEAGAYAWQVNSQALSSGWVHYSVTVPPQTNSLIILAWEIQNGPNGAFDPTSCHVDAVQWIVQPVVGPSVKFYRAGSNLVVWWNAAGAEGCRLLRAPNVTGAWQSFSHTRSTNSGTISVTVPMTGSQMFYKLVNP